jgi:protein disulfide-isomerase
MKSAIATAVLIALALNTATIRAGEEWFLEFEEGQAAAKAQGKDLLIDFGGSDWCLACQRLKERVLSKPEFIVRASADFVLVDIDLPVRTPIAADRKQRYEQLQKRYGIQSFPSLVLALPEGRPYARTTYREALQTPEAYWKHLKPLRERGQRLRAALDRSEALEGPARAKALVDGLSELNARYVPLFYAEYAGELRALDPSDTTGYLAFLDGRRALDDFQAGLDVHTAAIDPVAVEALIARSKLQGELLQEALVLRAAGEVLAGHDRQAVGTFAAVLDAQASRTRFDHGDFIPLDAPSVATVRRRIAEAEADPTKKVALYYALHRIFTFDLPNAYEMSCSNAFVPGFRVNEPIADRYGRALIDSTEGLEAEIRAKALGKGLEGTLFPLRGSIREIILELIPSLVGKEKAKALLPGEFYPRFIQ